MKRFWTILIVLIFLTSVSYACTIDVSNAYTRIRTETGEYSEAIEAEHNDRISIRTYFKVNDFSGNCASNITARIRVYRQSDGGDWVLHRTNSQSETLTKDEYWFTWINEFTVSRDYDRYKIEGIVLEGSNEIRKTEAFVDVVDNTCRGIKLVIDDFVIDEGREITRNFRIENNTNKNFEISNLRVSFTSSLITSGTVDYSSYISRYSSGIARVALRAGNVSQDRTITGTFAVSGYLDGKYCSETDIGRENFDVTVRETGYYDPYPPTYSGDCRDIQIVTRNITVNENESKKEIFYLQNNSNNRFEITDVRVIDSGLEVRPYYYPKYVHTGNIGDIILSLEAPNVFRNETHEQVLRVSGRFSDGRTCSFTNIGDNSFFVTIRDTDEKVSFSCGGLAINTRKSIEIEEVGKTSDSITNNTGKRAVIYVEGNARISPSVIAIPNGTSINQELTIETREAKAEIILRPIVEGCHIESEKIIVYNKSSGTIENVFMDVEINREESIIRINFENPTTRSFRGVLKFNLEGQIIQDRAVTIPRGSSFVEIKVDEEKPIAGRIKVVSDGLEKEIEIRETRAPMTGLFLLLGGFSTIIGIVLLIVIATIIIVSLTEKEERKKEPWENTEEKK